MRFCEEAIWKYRILLKREEQKRKMRETYECLKTLSQNGLFCNFHYKMKCFDENERRFYIRYVGSALLCAVFKINSDSYEII